MPPPLAQRLSLARLLALEIGALIVLMLLVLAGLAYVSAGLLVREVAPAALGNTVALRAAGQGQLFGQAQASVLRLREEWLHRAGTVDAAQAEARFDQLFARSDDGLWRLRPGRIDTERAPTFYLQHGQAGPDGPLRQRAVLSYELLREQGPALVPPFFSVYMDFVEKGLMVFARGVDWARSATPQTDNHLYPTMQGADPARNPDRQVFWTPVYFDAEAGTWMVSVIAPLDWGGRWVGTVGHDLSVEHLLSAVSASSSGSELGTQSLILSADGQLLAHAGLRERIAAARGQLALSQLKDPLMDEIQALIRAGGKTWPQVARSADGGHWVAWAPIAGPGWWSVTVLPQSLVDARLRQALLGLLAVGLLCLGLALWQLRRVIRTRVRQPLGQLSRALDQVAAGESPPQLALKASVDLARLAQAFDAMNAQLLAQRAAQQAHALALEHEVGERRSAEAAVRELNETLELRVRERSEALRLAQDELVQKETLASLGSLVAGVAHELNTPIGTALISADTAQAALAELRALLGGGGPVRRQQLVAALERAQEGLGLALGNLQRAATLVQDFKQVAVDRASLQRRRFDLRLVSEEVLNLLRHASRPRDVQVLLQLPEGLWMDSYPGALGQVLTNLVQNALLHAFEGRSGGQVLISLRSSSDRQIELVVSDNGCGMEPALQAQVFKPFFTTKLGRGGSGLGLHIVYNIVGNVLGGSITLESEPGAGSRFVLKLPRQA